MKPRDLFGVVIRCLGLLMLVGSVLYLYSAIAASVAPDTPGASSPLSYIAACAVLLLISAYFLRGAPHLVRFAYRDEVHQNAEASAAPNGGLARQHDNPRVTEAPPAVS